VTDKPRDEGWKKNEMSGRKSGKKDEKNLGNLFTPESH